MENNEELLNQSGIQEEKNRSLLLDRESYRSEEEDLLNKKFDYGHMGDDDSDLFDTKKTKRIRKKLKAVPVKKPKKAVKKMEKSLGDQIDEAFDLFYHVKKTSFKTQGKAFTEQYSPLGFNQKIKRKRKAKDKKVWSESAKRYNNQLKEKGDKLPDLKLPEAEEARRTAIQNFLNVSLEDFRFNTDKEFTENLEHNYDLVAFIFSFLRI